MYWFERKGGCYVRGLTEMPKIYSWNTVQWQSRKNILPYRTSCVLSANSVAYFQRNQVIVQRLIIAIEPSRLELRVSRHQASSHSRNSSFILWVEFLEWLEAIRYVCVCQVLRHPLNQVQQINLTLRSSVAAAIRRGCLPHLTDMRWPEVGLFSARWIASPSFSHLRMINIRRHDIKHLSS